MGDTRHRVSQYSICDELSTYDEELTKKDQINRLIRSLPDSFASLSFYISTNENTSFEVVENAVSTELELRANPNNQRHQHNGNNGTGEYKKSPTISAKELAVVVFIEEHYEVLGPSVEDILVVQIPVVTIAASLATS